MSAGHTPGPWEHVEWNYEPRTNEDGNRFWSIKPVIFHIGAEYLEATGWMTEANARLIAAAPELLELIEDIEQSLTADNTYRLLREACRELIAKAKGGAA